MGSPERAAGTEPSRNVKAAGKQVADTKRKVVPTLWFAS